MDTFKELEVFVNPTLLNRVTRYQISQEIVIVHPKLRFTQTLTLIFELKP